MDDRPLIDSMASPFLASSIIVDTTKMLYLHYVDRGDRY